MYMNNGDLVASGPVNVRDRHKGVSTQCFRASWRICASLALAVACRQLSTKPLIYISCDDLLLGIITSKIEIEIHKCFCQKNVSGSGASKMLAICLSDSVWTNLS